MALNEFKINQREYLLAAVVGAVGGGLIVALATRAIPKIFERVIQKLMLSMSESGRDPSET